VHAPAAAFPCSLCDFIEAAARLLRALLAAMPTSKPTNIDAQRILAIMDELKEKLTYLSVVTPQVLEGLQSEEGAAACDLLGPDLVKQFTEQIRLEEVYVVNNQNTDGYAHEGDNEGVSEDVKSLQKNTLELCRKMRAIPNIVQELRHFQVDRPEKMVNFLKTLVEMQELTLKRLTTTVEEERSKQELLEHYKVKAADATKRKNLLEKDLNHIRREKDRSQNHRSEILTKLKADLQDVKENKESRMQSLKQRYDSRYLEYQEQFGLRKTQYQNQIEALRVKNAKVRDENQKAEHDFSHKLVRRVEMDVESEIRKYDTAIKDMAYHLNEHTENYERDKKVLKELKDHFLKVDAEKECIGNEEGIADARRAKLEYEKNRRGEASAIVQAFWRGILQREAYQVMKKSKKKNQKKGKGKK